MRAKQKTTNWDVYYQKTSFITKLTRKSTEKRLIAEFNSNEAPAPIKTICELGGANSCFFSALRRYFPNSFYTILDNNEAGINQFKKLHAQDALTALLCTDLLGHDSLPSNNDVVFSVGLIEHFSTDDRATIIKKHFLCSKPGGLVIITFPTPTWLYRSLRWVLEQCHLWIFHDEIPLEINTVIDEIKPYAQVLKSYINWQTLLTQGVIVAKTNNTLVN